MRKVVLYEYLTLDGVMESPEKWQFPYLNDDTAEFNKTKILSLDASLLGRVTYEIFSSYWPLQTNNEFGLADKINSATKFVVSSTLKKVEWNNSILIQGNVEEEVAKLKRQPGGDIGIVGSRELARSLMQTNVIDEYWLLVHPIILGNGERLFGDGIKLDLKLIETKRFKSGVVFLRYRPNGK